MTYQLLLFDIDGTLIDSFSPYQQIMQAILPQFHRQATPQQLRQTFAMAVPQEMAALDIAPAQKDRLLAAYDAESKRRQYLEPLYPGVAATLFALQKTGVKLGVVTARNDADLQQMDPTEFLNDMAVVVSADSLPYHKPDPRPLLHAAAQLQVPPAATLYVGDALSDAKAAQSAGIDFAAALWGATPGQTFPTARYQLTQPQDILKIMS